mgnify:FL=1
MQSVLRETKKEEQPPAVPPFRPSSLIERRRINGIVFCNIKRPYSNKRTILELSDCQLAVHIGILIRNTVKFRLGELDSVIRKNNLLASREGIFNLQSTQLIL